MKICWSKRDDAYDAIFQNGKRFLNIEIIYPGTQNVVMYGPKAYIQFHGVDEFDLFGIEIHSFSSISRIILGSTIIYKLYN